MKILMLVNWKMNYLDSDTETIQSPDKVVKGVPYWFFKHFKEQPDVDVVGINTEPKFLYNFERNNLHFYIRQPFSVISKYKKYDLIISHGSQSSLVLSVFERLLGKNNTRHLLIDVGCMNGGKEGGLSLTLSQYASKALDGVIYHASIQKGYYERQMKDIVNKAYFVPFGTELSYYYPNDKLAEGDYVLAYGAIKRDYKTFIECAQKMPNIPFVIIGVKNLPYEIPSNVKILPFMKIHELRDYIWQAKMIVSPLPVFNFAYGQMTLLQAMACRKAVVVTKTPSTEDYITDQKTAFFIKPYDAEDMREKIELLYKDDKLRKQIASKAHLSIKNDFNEVLMGKRIEDVIEKIMKVRY